jgi:hypothetical protein
MNTNTPSPVETKTVPEDTFAAKEYKTNPNGFVWGWTPQAERWNGRLAMLGFIVSIITELVVGHSVLGNIL